MKQAKRDTTARDILARARPSYEGMSQCPTGQQTGHIGGTKAKSVTGTGRPSGPPHPRHGERTAIASNVLAIAKRVIQNVASGRSYDARTVEWAEHIVKANAPVERYARVLEPQR